MAMAAKLPWDITIEILSRLPVKSLMRFKCVSKSFCSLISQDSQFKRKHLHQSNSTIRAIVNLEHAPDRLFSCSLSSLSSSSSSYELDMIELDNNPIKGAKYSECKVHNSCDGLLCIEDKTGTVCIWNPSTRELKRLPDCVGARWILYDRIAYGLGYDSSSDDYKLLSIYRYRLSRNLGTEFQLCSLKREASWRKIRDFPCGKFAVWDSFQFFNGAFYWIENIGEYSNRRLVIVSFEIKKEKFREFEVAAAAPIKYTMFDVSVLGGKLCLYSSFSKVSFDLWVIQEYGVMESLKKMLSIRIDHPEPHISKSVYYLFKPLYLFEDGKIMLHIIANNGREQVNIYKDGDSAPKTTADNCNIRRAYIYNQTLISPHINI